MQYVNYEYMIFVPDKRVENGIPNTICVYTKKFKNKIHKRKTVQLGIIMKIGKEYCFNPLEHYKNTNVFLKSYTMHIIASFLTSLNSKKIIFNARKGTIKPNTQIEEKNNEAT